MMNDDELLRYSRHMLLPEIGAQGQIKLSNARVLIIGMGGLGCPVAMYLAAAGIGHLQISDDDTVDLSNLQRQVLYSQEDIGQHKVTVASARLRQLNPLIDIETINTRLTESELRSRLQSVDVVVDASDNFTSRYLINALSQQTTTPLVSGAVIRFEGQISIFNYNKESSPCYACLFPRAGYSPPENCENSGIIAPLAGIIGSMQALEVIKLITDVGDHLGGKLLTLNALTMTWRSLMIKKDPNCEVCQNSHWDDSR